MVASGMSGPNGRTSDIDRHKHPTLHIDNLGPVRQDDAEQLVANLGKGQALQNQAPVVILQAERRPVPIGGQQADLAVKLGLIPNLDDRNRSPRPQSPGGGHPSALAFPARAARPRSRPSGLDESSASRRGIIPRIEGFRQVFGALQLRHGAGDAGDLPWPWGISRCPWSKMICHMRVRTANHRCWRSPPKHLATSRVRCRSSRRRSGGPAVPTAWCNGRRAGCESALPSR